MVTIKVTAARDAATVLAGLSSARTPWLTLALAGPADHEIRDAPPLEVVRRRCLVTGGEWLLERFKVRVDVFHVGLFA